MHKASLYSNLEQIFQKDNFVPTDSSFFGLILLGLLYQSIERK